MNGLMDEMMNGWMEMEGWTVRLINGEILELVGMQLN